MVDEDEKFIHEIIISKTKSVTENGNIVKRSNLTKRRLEKIIESKRGDRILPGHDRTMKILFNLVSKGLIEIRVDDHVIQDRSQKHRGKKWEIVSTDLSKELQNNYKLVKMNLYKFDEEISKLEKISKFEPGDFATFLRLRTEVLAYPFGLYLKESSIADSVREEIISNISADVKMLINRLKKVGRDQVRRHSNFDEIITELDTVIRNYTEFITRNGSSNREIREFSKFTLLRLRDKFKRSKGTSKRIMSQR